MSAYRLAYLMLFLLGVSFALAPLFGDFKGLARWMRVGLHMVGVCLFAGAAFGVALHSIAPRLSPQRYRFLWAQELLLFGMGFGILLFLLISWDTFAALNRMHRERKLPSDTSEDGHEQV